MDKVVQMHAVVVVLAGPRAQHDLVRRFPAHEVVSASSVSRDLVGEPHRPDLWPIVLAEMRHRVALKLSLGERAVVVLPFGSCREHRLRFVHTALLQGAGAIYLLDGDGHDAQTRAGDDLARVFEAGTAPRIAVPLAQPPLASLRAAFRGVTVVGDVHGNLEGLRDALAWARSRQHFVWFLGDVIDYGEHSLQAVERAYDAVMRGEAAFLLGNHERKIARWLAQQDTRHGRGLRLSEGNKRTVEALERLDRERRAQWVGKFRSLLGRAALLAHLGDVSLAHAAVHPSVWASKTAAEPAADAAALVAGLPAPSVAGVPAPGVASAVEDHALYGESDPAARPAFALSYRWVNAVPAGRTVFVGHDIRATAAPLVITGASGGRVVFLDTGSGKGGALSTADLRFSGGRLVLENFNRHRAA